MPFTNRTQWVIPFKTKFGGKQGKLIINRDNINFNIAANDQFILDPTVSIVKSLSPHIMDYVEEDALVALDMAYIELEDVYAFRGTVNGVASGEVDLQVEGKSLVWGTICDATELTIWKAFLKADGTTWEYRFCGDVNVNEIERKPHKIPYEGTSSENPLSLVRLGAKPDRLSKYTVRDLLKTITTADLVGKSGTPKKPYPHYGGSQMVSTPQALFLLDNAEPKVPSFALADRDSNWNNTLAATGYNVYNPMYPVTADPITDTLTFGGFNPFANDTIVNLDIIRNWPGSTYPGGLNGTTDYYVVNANASTFKVSLTSGGAPVDITSIGATLPPQGCIGVKDISNPTNTYDKQLVFQHFAYTGRIANLSLYPSGMWGITLDTIVSKACAITGVDYAYTTPSADEHSLAFAKATWNNTTKRFEHTFDSPVTLISAIPVSFNVTFGVSPNYGFAVTSIDTGTDTITVSNWKTGLVAEDPDPFSDGDIIHIRISDSGSTVPAGLEQYTDYYVINATRASATSFTFKLSATSGGSAIDITTAGTGSQFVGNFNIKTGDSFDWDTPLKEVIKDLCLGKGFVVEHEVTQSGGDTGKPILKLVRRRFTTSTEVPANWKLLGDQTEKRRESKQKAVRVGYVGDTETFTCPTRDEKNIFDVKLRWRNHPWSDDAGIVRSRNLMYNGKAKLWEQGVTWWVSDGAADEQFNLHVDGWVGGSCLYEEKTATTNDRYPPAWDSNALDLAGTGTDYSGLYVRSKVRYRDQEVSFDSLPRLIAILLANEVLHPDQIIEVHRTYGGILDDAGSILTPKPRMTKVIGDRTFRVMHLEQDEMEGTSEVIYLPVPANVNELDMTLPVFDGSNGTTSTGGGGGGGGGTAVNTNTTDDGDLASNPLDNARNDVTPGEGVTTAIALRANVEGDASHIKFFSAFNSSHITFRAPDTVTTSHGYTWPGALPAGNYILQSSTAGVLTWVDPASLFDSSGLVTKSPATTDRNMIIATADGVEALAIKRYGGSSVGIYTFSVYDAGGSLKFGIDGNLNVQLQSSSLIFGSNSPISLGGSHGTSGVSVITSAGSGSTPTWASISSLITDAVIINPGASTRNVVQPSGNFIAQVWKNNGSQVVNLNEWHTSGGSVMSSVSKDGYFRINNNGTIVGALQMSQPASTHGIVMFAQSGASGGHAAFILRDNADANNVFRLGDTGKVAIGVGAIDNGFLTVLQASLGSPVLALMSVATNDDPKFQVTQGRATTTDGATWTTVATITMSTSTTQGFFVILQGVRTGGTGGAAQDGWDYGFRGYFKNAAGTVTQIGATTALWQHESNVNGNFRFNINGTAVEIQALGVNNNNITWHAPFIGHAPVGS